MTQKKNDTPILVAALVLTVAILGGAGWWLMKQFGTPPLPSSSPAANPSANSPINPAPIPLGGNGQATFANVATVPQGAFNYGGSTTWAPIRGEIDPQITLAHPGFQLQYTNPTSGTPGSSTGIQMLIDGQLDFAQSSRSLNPTEIQAAQQRGFTLKEIPVAIEGIAIAVHPDLNIPGLTLDQLRRIYTGQLTNWSQVGGPNIAITPYTRSLESGGTVKFFVDNVLNNQPFGNIQLIGTTTEALRAVGQDLSGIYYASAPEVVGQCTTKPLPIGPDASNLVPIHAGALIPASQCPNQRNQINTAVLLDGSYPITRNLTVVVKENGQQEQDAGNAYADLILTQQGQQLLEASGFVRIR